MEGIKGRFKDKEFKKNILIFLVIFIFAVFLLNWLIKTLQSDSNEDAADNFSKYYKVLLARCNSQDRKFYDCCFNSVAYMAASNYELAPGLGCAPGLKLNIFNCVGSYKWCEPAR